MTYLVYIQGLSGAGFRVPNAAGGFSRVKENVTVQVDLDNVKTQLILAGERDNFIRVASSGATTAVVAGLNRRGFRILDNTSGLQKVVKVGTAYTVDLTKGEVRRRLRRSVGQWVSVASAGTAVSVRGIQAEQNGFFLDTSLAATAVLTSDGTAPAAGDTVVIENVTYRFESTLAQANDVQIGANSNASLDNLVLAVNQTGTAGTNYFAGTVAPTDVTAAARVGTGAGATVTFTAKTPGTGGNAYASTETSAHLSFGGTTFSGGAQEGGFIKVYRGITAVVDATKEDVYTRLRRLYHLWIEG